MKTIQLNTNVTIKLDSNDNIKSIKSNVLSACSKPMIEYEVQREYQKQINNQLTQIF